MAILNLTVTGGDGNTYIIANDSRENLKRLSTLFQKLAGGNATTTYTVDCRSSSVAASAVVTAAAVQVADTITLNGTAITATRQNAIGTCTFSSLANNDTVTVNGQVFTAKTTVVDATTQFALGASDTAAAANLVTLVNASLLSLVYNQFTATSAAGVVTFRAYLGGTAGNSITLASSDNGRAAVSGATLANGAAIANNQFDPGGSNTECADSILRCIAASTTDLISKVITATRVAGVVTFKAKVPGFVGNAITIATSNGTRLAITGGVSRFAGGTETVNTISI